VRLSDHASRLNLASGRRDLPPLILMSDQERLPDPVPLASRLPPGAAVMVRHRDPYARRRLAERLTPLCRAHALRLIVADDAALARDIDAFGLHLPEERAAAADAGTVRRQWTGMLSVAAHSPKAVRRAAAIGADAAVLSPVFATPSHPDARAIGVMRFHAWCRGARLPVYALGGVNMVNAGRLVSPRIVGIAGIGGVA
jgi:thiamine-phosphate pyrophosphorylase